MERQEGTAGKKWFAWSRKPVIKWWEHLNGNFELLEMLEVNREWVWQWETSRSYSVSWALFTSRPLPVAHSKDLKRFPLYFLQVEGKGITVIYTQSLLHTKGFSLGKGLCQALIPGLEKEFILLLPHLALLFHAGGKIIVARGQGCKEIKWEYCIQGKE